MAHGNKHDLHNFMSGFFKIKKITWFVFYNYLYVNNEVYRSTLKGASLNRCLSSFCRGKSIPLGQNANVYIVTVLVSELCLVLWQHAHILLHEILKQTILRIEEGLFNLLYLNSLNRLINFFFFLWQLRLFRAGLDLRIVEENLIIELNGMDHQQTELMMSNEDSLC